jgi:Uma2 family endonuclease
MPPYYHGRGGGPGGWIIIIEPEIKLGEDILVPDLAGWRKERFPLEEPHNWISVSPDWVCEMLSPGSWRVDRIDKMPVYAQYGVSYLWFIDPLSRTLEIFQLQDEKWVVAGLYKGDAKIRAVPFIEIEINLSDLWPEGWDKQ